MALIKGKNGNDNLKGTNASDTLQGSGGDDTLFGGFSGDDILDGGDGTDTASYQIFSKVNPSVNASLEINQATFVGGSETFINIENLIGGNNRDTLTGNGENNRLDGRSGSDDISGRAGNDTLIGGAGFDTLNGELGDDRLFGGDDADLLDGGDGKDFLAGEKGNDTAIGGSGDDEFQWMEGDGNDLIQGGEGNDNLNLLFSSSSPKADNISYLTQSGSDIVLRRNNLVPVTLTTQGIESFNVINVGSSDGVLNVSNLSVASGVEFIKFTGGDGNDRLNADSNVSPNITAIGGNGNDSLTGGNGNDSLFGDRGNDVIFGGNGNDLIKGAESTNLGRGEIDVLTGAADQDTFVLDNFYDDGNIRIDGTGDFARITDFIVGEDLIQLSGSFSSYELKPITNSLQGGSAAQDMGVFKTGFRPELIAIVHDAPSTLNINDSAQFKFI